MKKKKMGSIFLAILLSLSMSVTAIAAPNVNYDNSIGVEQSDEDAYLESEPVNGAEQTDEEQENQENDAQEAEPDKAEAEGETLEAADSETTTETSIQETEAEQAEVQQAEEPETEAADTESADEVLDTSKWTTADFTYTTMERTLNGCDYTREFVVKGTAIAGFSESGEEKIKVNKNLVIPSTDDNGEALVGVADNAFSGYGITSVTFPTGMKVDYDDTVTNVVTRRGNFIIGQSAFAKNELTSVYLPDGVIAVMSSAFRFNKLQTVTLPRSIWWIETLSFANNEISTVNFPVTCDFQMEMHGMAFAQNNIKSVRLPDFTAVVNKDVFTLNPGMEDCPSDAPDKQKSLGGVVYMYTENPNLDNLDRIHTVDKTTESQKSWHQKVIVSAEYENASGWSMNDFTIEGTTITGLSESGIAKRSENKNLVLPGRNAAGEYITEIASTDNDNGGLFGTADEGFDTVELPSQITKIGMRAFANTGLKDVSFPETLKEIGVRAFAGNNLTSIILPNSVVTVGGGAFGTNKLLERIVLSKNMTEITTGAFGCSDAQNWMANLTSIDIPEGIETIGNNAFAGNNFSKIVIPSTVKKIGNYAFSTKNYLKTSCTLELPEGLETIGSYAFRNKIIESVELPTTVTKLPANTFTKEYSDDTVAIVTKVYVTSSAQYHDTKNFPASDYHKLYLKATDEWTAEDFTYGEITNDLHPANNMSDTLTVTSWAITGFSEQGLEKLKVNKNLVIPATDPDGKAVTGIADSALQKQGIESVTFPENVKTAYDGKWNSGLTERGNFVIGASAFLGNNLKKVVLPEGVIMVKGNAFKNNPIVSVEFPATIMCIGSQAFAGGKTITTLSFVKDNDFNLQIDNMAFALNLIQAVQLPNKVEKVTKLAFFQNTGKEPVTTGNVNEKKGGIVYMYCENEEAASQGLIDTVDNGNSNVQKLIIGTIPGEDSPWNVDDFTYSEDETTITGLSDVGKSKLKLNPAMILPSESPNGTVITAIGNGVNGVGTLGFKDTDDTVYEATSVSLPSQLKSIGNMAFSGAAITEITLPETLESIGSAAFSNSKLTSIVLPNSVTSLGTGAFSNSASLASVVLSNQLTTIPQAAFTMTALTKAEIPEGVTSIGRNAFAGAHLTELSLPSSLTEIGRYAFMNHQLQSIEIPASVTKIEQSAFTITQEGMEAYPETLILHEGLTSIGQDAFRGSALTDVELPSTVTTLHKDAFRYGTAVVKLRTSSKVQVEEPATTFVVKGTNHEVVYDVLAGSGWTADDFVYDGSKLTGWSESGKAKRTTLKNLVLPDNTPDGTAITEIGEAAFKVPDDEIEQLKDSVNSPNGMQTVHFPEQLQTIGKQAFEYNNFEQIEIPETVSFIGECAFKGNKLTKVSLSDSVTEMGSGAFSMNDITELKLSKGLKVIPNGAFSMNINLSQIELPDGITEIQEMAFAGARLTSLEIPTSVEKIGRKAFHLHHIEELVIPGNVKEIGESAFEGTYKAQTLKKLTLEEGILSIGKYAFKEGLLTEVTLPNSLETFGEEPFKNNVGTDENHTVICYTDNIDHLKFGDSSSHKIQYTGIIIDENTPWDSSDFTYSEDETTITGLSDVGKMKIKLNTAMVIPSEGPNGTTITAIGNGVNGVGTLGFKDENGTVYQAKSVVLPAQLKSIGNMAFSGAVITEITLPETLESIGNAAFSNSKLTSIVLPNSLTSLGSGAFSNSASLASVVLSNKLTTIPQAAFTMTALTKVEIPEGVTSVGRNAFAGAHLTELSLPSTLTEIGRSAFMNHQLQSIEIPASVTKIAQSAFTITQDGMKAYPETLILHEGLVSIEKEAFRGSGLTDVNLPTTVTTLNKDAFKNGTSVVKLHTTSKVQLEATTTFEPNGTNHEVVYDDPTIGKWMQDAKGWWYKNADGTYPSSTWQVIDEEWYYFDAAGYRAEGWKAIGGKWYYFDKETGIMASNAWVDNHYYVSGSGAMATGWLKLDEGWYYLGTNGVVQTGWIQVGNNWYYGQPDSENPGLLVENDFRDINGATYYFKAGGYMVISWQVIDGADYFFNGSGAMTKNQWSGSYYLGEDGKLLSNVWVGVYHVGADGAYQKGWLKLDEGWYYLGTNGVVQTGWIQLGNNWYYGQPDSENPGLLVENAFRDINGARYYFKAGGYMAISWQVIDGEDYFFTESGAMARSQWSGNYYLKADGKMARNEWVDGGKYFVDENGVWVPNAK